MEALSVFEELKTLVINHITQIYPEQDAEQLSKRLIDAMGIDGNCKQPMYHQDLWTEEDIAVITYGNSFLRDDETPLDTLWHFLSNYLHDSISIVHILPFYPYSSDDGFAVKSYTSVSEEYGDWHDIEHISGEFKLMADLVINHCSGQSDWFEQFKRGELPGKDYFYCASPDADLSEVVRPRTSPLLREVSTPQGSRHVWCTFSHDQPDLDFSNPDVLIEFVRIIRFYLERGIRIFRFDAIAFLWKEPGSSCINLPQTHEIVRLLRTLIEHHDIDAIIITETNIPNRENLAYFGNANEAHLIYNFPLPPLLVNTMVTGNSHALKNWLMSLPPAMSGTTYFNIIASHDGIGLRPGEGLLSEDQISDLVKTMESFGGLISWRAQGNGIDKPYEINITLFDAMKGTIAEGPDEWQEQRFICLHAIMLGLEGLPAFYIHSLLGSQNDYEKMKLTNNFRAINRKNWHIEEIEELLATDTHHSRILKELQRLIALRRKQPAFHPNATMFTLHLGDEVCAVWRQNRTREQSIFAISNVTKYEHRILLTSVNLTVTDSWTDLISGEEITEEQTELLLRPYQTVWLSNVVNT